MDHRDRLAQWYVFYPSVCAYKCKYVKYKIQKVQKLAILGLHGLILVRLELWHGFSVVCLADCYVKAKVPYAILVADRFETGRRPASSLLAS